LRDIVVWYKNVIIFIIVRSDLHLYNAKKKIIKLLCDINCSKNVK